MAAFTGTLPWSGMTALNAGLYTPITNTSEVHAVANWVPLPFTISMPVKIFRGAQVKIWTGLAWALAPPS